MGFTALEGLPMGTRCGAIDPGVILHLLTEWARQAMLAFDPPLANAEDLAIPRCAASADEALAIIQSHRATWLRAQPVGGPR